MLDVHGTQDNSLTGSTPTLQDEFALESVFNTSERDDKSSTCTCTYVRLKDPHERFGTSNLPSSHKGVPRRTERDTNGDTFNYVHHEDMKPFHEAHRDLQSDCPVHSTSNIFTE